MFCFVYSRKELFGRPHKIFYFGCRWIFYYSIIQQLLKSSGNFRKLSNGSLVYGMHDVSHCMIFSIAVRVYAHERPIKYNYALFTEFFWQFENRFFTQFILVLLFCFRKFVKESIIPGVCCNDYQIIFFNISHADSLVQFYIYLMLFQVIPANLSQFLWIKKVLPYPDRKPNFIVVNYI